MGSIEVGEAPKSAISLEDQKAARELLQNIANLKRELTIASEKCAEIEMEIDEHNLVLETVSKNSNRKCYKLFDGVLIEKSGSDIRKGLIQKLDEFKKIAKGLAEDSANKEKQLEELQRQANMRMKPAGS